MELRRDLGLSGPGPTPVIVTRGNTAGIDFTAPFFNRHAQGQASYAEGSTAASPPVVLAPEMAVSELQSAFEATAPRGAQARIVAIADHSSLDIPSRYTPEPLTPVTALQFCFQSLGATGVSLECGPSVARELYSAGQVGALALSALHAHDTDTWGCIPALSKDPLFGDPHSAIYDFRRPLQGGRVSTDLARTGGDLGWEHGWWLAPDSR